MLTTHHLTRFFVAALLVVLFLHTARAADTLRVTFVGDVLLDRGVRERIDTMGADALFTPSVDSLFQASHLVVANLECPATHIVAPVMKKYIFRGDPEHLATLRRHGITHLDLANNHSIDQGRRGLTDTRRHIEAAGMVLVGAGDNMREAAEPVLLADKPRKVWLVASLRLPLENFAYLPHRPCVSQEPMDTLVARVAQLRQHDPECVVIVLLHWGGENTTRPVVSQLSEAHRLIDAGAQLIVGHHPHTLQPVEQYKGCPIYYSIGNFIFDALRPIHSEGLAVTTTITANSVATTHHHVSISHCAPRLTTEKNPSASK